MFCVFGGRGHIQWCWGPIPSVLCGPSSAEVNWSLMQSMCPGPLGCPARLMSGSSGSWAGLGAA